MADRHYCLDGLDLRVSISETLWVENGADGLQNMYLVHVHHNLWSIDDGIQLLPRGRDAGIVILYLGSWFVTAK